MKSLSYDLPLITVVVPVHVATRERYLMLKRAISSVLSQTYINYELIVVDDGSPVSLDLSDFPEIRLIRIPHSGVSAARNYGISVGDGEWIALLDSDDTWDETKLEAQVEYSLKNPYMVIHQCDDIWIRNGVRVNPKKYQEKIESDIFGESLKRCLINPSAVMLKRSLLHEVGLFNANLPTCEDYDLWLRIALKNKVGLLRQKLVTRYGGHPCQLSFKYSAMDRYRVISILDLIDRELTYLSPEKGLDKIVYKKLVSAADVAKVKLDILVSGARKRNLVENISEYTLWQKELDYKMKKLYSITSNY